MKKSIIITFFLLFAWVACLADGVGLAPITVEEADGTPSLTQPTKVIFANGSLTDNGDWTVSVAAGGGGGDSVTVNGSDADTTANFKDGTGATWTLTDGGAGGPDDISVAITGVAELSVDAAGVKLDTDGDGQLTLLGLGDGFDEDLTINLDDVENRIVLNSTTGASFRFDIYSYYDAATYYNDNIGLTWGGGADATIQWEDTGMDNLQLGLNVNDDTYSGYFSIMERGDLGNANRSPAAKTTNPTLRIYSADEAEATDYIEFHHNQTNGVIDVGSGSVVSSSAWDLGGAVSLEVPNGTDPDVDAAGELAFDSDGANETGDCYYRGFDGSNQYPVGQKIKTINVTLISPDTIDAADLIPIWHNTSGMTFTIVEWKAWSDDDDVSLELEELTDMTDFTAITTVDAVEIATNGTSVYYASDATITHAAIEHDHTLAIDFDTNDTPDYVHIAIKGFFNADVD